MASKVATIETQLEKIEKVVEECSLDKVTSGKFSRALTLSRGITALRGLFTKEIMNELLPLKGSALGFPTDERPGTPYSAEEVKEALIEGFLQGALPVNREINIISKRAYLGLEFFKRKMREHKTLTDLKIKLGVPDMKTSGAVVTCSATWLLSGQKDSIEAEIPVRMNKGMGADAVLGKAERKFRYRIWNQITGCQVMEGEVDDVDAIAGAKEVEIVEEGSKTDRLKKVIEGENKSLHEMKKDLEEAEKMDSKDYEVPEPKFAEESLFSISARGATTPMMKRLKDLGFEFDTKKKVYIKRSINKGLASRIADEVLGHTEINVQVVEDNTGEMVFEGKTDA